MLSPESPSPANFLDTLEQRVQENKSAQTQSPGIIYKLLAEHLGVAPWRLLIPLAFIIGFLAVVILRGWAVRGVSLLQWGF